MPLKGYIVLLDEFLYKIGFDVDSGKIKQIEQGLKISLILRSKQLSLLATQ